MSALTVSFICHLAFVCRELMPTLAESLNDNGGQVLPHLIMADYLRIVEGNSELTEWKTVLLECLEQAMTEEKAEIRELIAVSFIEHLPVSTDAGHWLVGALGPNLRKRYRIVFGI
ncbi:hypothetical protein G6L85_17950 [Agrobacterium rhizogenes]|jgi:hypothetical protein|uniref:DUF7674 family protein n=1 Tax=Rhizobium rhizogenes TaxID=359 RepID=UPI001574EC99|nr:hypothetical protein [Rhizobium rhizogenes]NTH14015.1 hypothetical protein [Rhizobium rhizogenes]NTI63399.1 hypothetical protein [Rhizobium rhizogenes]